DIASITFSGPAPPKIHPLSLPDALPISVAFRGKNWSDQSAAMIYREGESPTAGERKDQRQERDEKMPELELHRPRSMCQRSITRSEEHTSELQSLRQLVCRLLLEKKKVE